MSGNFDSKLHWENIYQTKDFEQCSWYQKTPETSIELIRKYAQDKDAKIIDIGGGDSFLVDHLLDLGYTNISVLDISSSAIERAKKRLGPRAEEVAWIVSDIRDFDRENTYDIWHDRAAFHFLRDSSDQETYVNMAKQATRGNIIIGSFAKDGPTKCSGIEIQQHTEDSLSEHFAPEFMKTECFYEEHATPFESQQKFIFCCFEKNKH